MGMSETQVLRGVELPVAMPLIVSGVRLAVVQVWATATIAALVAGPGLGRIITHGYDSNHPAEVISGSIIVAVGGADPRGDHGPAPAGPRPAARGRRAVVPRGCQGHALGSPQRAARPRTRAALTAGHRRWEQP